jgi:hypothetical protein
MLNYESSVMYPAIAHELLISRYVLAWRTVPILTYKVHTFQRCACTFYVSAGAAVRCSAVWQLYRSSLRHYRALTYRYIGAKLTLQQLVLPLVVLPLLLPLSLQPTLLQL